jgi:hypothetical protein
LDSQPASLPDLIRDAKRYYSAVTTIITGEHHAPFDQLIASRRGALQVKDFPNGLKYFPPFSSGVAGPLVTFFLRMYANRASEYFASHINFEIPSRGYVSQPLNPDAASEFFFQ